MTDFTRRSNTQREMERVAITSVDPVTRTATGVTRVRTTLHINCAYATGDTITTPAVGEQWYIERLDMEWRLYGRIPFNDATLNIEPEEGQVSVGSASGPLELNGTEIRSNGTVFRLNGVYYRDDGETLQRSEDKEVWEPISAQTAGILQLIGNALAGIPGSAAVADFLADLDPDDTAALQGLMQWASNLGDSVGDNLLQQIVDAITGAGTFLSGPLYTLQQLFSGITATGGNLISQITASLGEFASSLDIAALVSKITGININDLPGDPLAALGQFFAGFSTFIPGSPATTLLGQVLPNLITELATIITNGTTTLADFFAGLGGGTATVTSLVHQIVSAITGGTGVQGLTSLTAFFGGVTSTAATLVGRIVDHLTGLIAKGLSGMTLENFFSGFNTTATVTGSLAHRIAQTIGGTTATTLSQIDNFFANLRSFLGIGTTGISLTDFLSAPATFATKLTGIISNFITNVLQRTGLSTTLVTLTSGATKLAEDLIPDLSMDRITDLISYITGGVGVSKTDVDNFFKNLRTFLGGASGFLNPTGSFNLAAAAETFINNVLRNNAVTTRLVTLASGLSTIATDIIPELAISKITNLIGYITGTGAEALDIQRFFTNLRSTLGLSSTNLLANFDLTTARTALYNVVTGINNTIGTLAKQADMALKAGITEIVKAITGGTAASYPDLSQITSFFSGLAGMSGSSLLAKLTTAITGGATELGTFFTNLRSFFTNTGVNLGNFTAATGIPIFLKNLLNGSGLIPALNNYRLTITGVPTGGTFTLGYNGQTTGALGYDVTAAALQTALTGLSSIGAGEATVTGDLSAGFTVTINNLTGTLAVASSALTGGVNAKVTVTRQLATGLIPKLGVDWVSDIDDWVQQTLVSPIVSTLLTATGVDLSRFGIDLTQISTSLNNGLTALGVWAKNLLTTGSKISVNNLLGTIPNALLGIIPIANIADTSPNLLSQGEFGSASSLTEADGWTWDSTENNSGVSGTAKVTISTAKLRELFSQQAIPVTPGNKLNLSAWIKTAGLTPAAGTPIAISLIPYVGTARLTSGGNPVTVTAASGGTAANWTKISGDYTVPAGVTSVIVRLSVAATVTAGSVWFDDVSLVKTGLLAQNLVDRLIEGWNNLWDGLLGNPLGTSINKTVDGLFTAANSLWQNAQNTALNLTSLLGNLLSNAGSVIGNIGNVIMDGISTVGGFLTGMWNALTGSGSNTTPRTVSQVHAATSTVQITANNAEVAAGLAQTAADTAQTAAASAAADAYLAAVGTETLTGFFNEPRRLPAWQGQQTDDVAFPYSQIDGISTPAAGLLLFIPVVITQDRSISAIKLGFDGNAMTTCQVGLYSVDPTTGAGTKVIDLGNVKSQITLAYDRSEFLLPQTVSVQRGEIYYIGVLQTGTAQPMHRWAGSSYDFTIGTFPRSIGMNHITTGLTALPTSFTNAQVAFGGTVMKYWGALGVETVTTAPPDPAKVNYADTFDRANSSTLGSAWTIRSGGGLSIASNVASCGVGAFAASSNSAGNSYVARMGRTSHEVGATLGTTGHLRSTSYGSTRTYRLGARATGTGVGPYLQVTVSYPAGTAGATTTAQIVVNDQVKATTTYADYSGTGQWYFNCNGNVYTAWHYKATAGPRGSTTYEWVQAATWADTTNSWPVASNMTEVFIQATVHNGNSFSAAAATMNNWYAKDL